MAGVGVVQVRTSGQMAGAFNLEEWIEKEIKIAKEAAFSAAIRKDSDDVAFWRGYLTALRDVLSMIEEGATW